MAKSERSKKSKVLTSVAAVVLAASMLIGGGTYAYLQGETNDVVNEFNANQVTVDLKENTGNSYEIVPGTAQEKDPKVTVNATVPAYVFVTVEDTTDGLVDYAIADGWTKLDGYDNVYYREVAASDTAQEFYVLAGNTVSYDAALANSDMVDEDGNLKDGLALSFKAYAIQKDPFASAVEAWEQMPVSVSDITELQSAIADGKNAVLTEDITAGSLYIGANSANIDLNSHTLTAPITIDTFWGSEDTNSIVTIKNGTVTGAPSDNSYGLIDVYAEESQPTTVTFENVTVIPTSSDITPVKITNAGANVTLKNCDVTGNIYCEDGYLTIDGGTYTARDTDSNLIFSNRPVTINGGTFTAAGAEQKLVDFDGNGSFEFTINGGTFNYGAPAAIYVNMSSYRYDVKINGGTFNSAEYTADMFNSVVTIG